MSAILYKKQSLAIHSNMPSTISATIWGFYRRRDNKSENIPGFCL
jgi:hypothetical protein